MGQFVLTGSQNFLLLEQVSQSLAGRVALHTLLPFSRQELAASSDLSLDESLFKGGYPVLYDRGVAPPDYYPAYIQTYVERDVRSLRNIGDLSAFQRFLRVCAGRVGQLLDLSSLGNDLGINYKTVSAWISVLEASYIAFPALSASREFFQAAHQVAQALLLRHGPAVLAFGAGGGRPARHPLFARGGF